MAITVELVWVDGDPCLTVTSVGDDLHAVVDLRLSEAQMATACARMGEPGQELLEAWRARMGLSRQMAL